MIKRPTVFALAFATAITVGFAASPTAFAHAFLEKASPAAGATLAHAPVEITLQFSEALEPAFSAVTITGEKGATVQTPKARIEGNSMHLSPLTLGPGTYRVDWHVVSVDTHRTEGSYRFVVAP